MVEFKLEDIRLDKVPVEPRKPVYINLDEIRITEEDLKKYGYNQMTQEEATEEVKREELQEEIQHELNQINFDEEFPHGIDEEDGRIEDDPELYAAYLEAIDKPD